MRFHKEKASRFAGTLRKAEDVPDGNAHAPAHVKDKAQARKKAVDPVARHKDEPFLKPHPTVSAFECASELQYTVGTLGVGKRAYVDDEATWTHVPPMLRGRPAVMTAVQDAESRGTLISMFVDEPSDVYILLPAAEKTKRAKATSDLQELSWLPFKLPSLLGKSSKETPEEKDDVPSWMQGEYQVVEELTAVLSSGMTFNVWRKRVPMLGFLELGGNEGMTKRAKRGMYVAVLMPSLSAANMTIGESLPMGFPGSEREVKGAEDEEGGSADGRGSRRVEPDTAQGPSSLAGARKHGARGPRGTRGRARHRGLHVRGGARHTGRGRQSIMKALAALKQRLAAGGAGVSRKQAPAESGKGRHQSPAISADDLSDLVQRCRGRDEAGRCLVRAQACMSSRALSDPANCKCFVDAVESFSASQAATGSCTASCMAAVEEAYNGHVTRVTGKASPCL